MARQPLPDATSLGDLPSARSGRPIASYDTSAIGKGMASFGESVAAISQELNDRWDKVSTAQTDADYLKFTFDEANRFDEATRNMQPGQAQGFAKQYLDGYAER